MPVRNGVLARGHITANAVQNVIGTVPASDTWIIKSVFARNVLNVVATLQISVLSADGATFVNIINQSMNGNADVSIQTYFIAGPGDQVRVFFNNSGFDVWVSGASLPGHI